MTGVVMHQLYEMFPSASLCAQQNWLMQAQKMRGDIQRLQTHIMGVEGDTAGLKSRLSDLKHAAKAEKEQAQNAHHALVTHHQAGTPHCWLFI